MNLELGLTFKVVSVPNVPISLGDICISVAYQNVLLSIFFYLIQQDIVWAVNILFFAQNT